MRENDVPIEVKREVVQEQGGHCADCGNGADRIQIHHKLSHAWCISHGIPFWLANSKYNLVGLCADGQSRKGRREVLRDDHTYWNKQFERGIVYPGEPIRQAATSLLALGVIALQIQFIYGKNRH